MTLSVICLEAIMALISFKVPKRF